MDRRAGTSIGIFAAAFVWLSVLLVGSSAAAVPDLADQLPETHDTVVAVDFDQMRDSPLYDRAFEVLEGHPQAAPWFTRLDEEFDLDPRTDLSAVVATSKSPPLSSDMFDGPQAALDQAATTEQSDEAFLLIRGDFDSTSVLERLAQDSEFSGDGSESPTRLTSGAMAVFLIDDTTLAVATGPSEYLDEKQRQLDETAAGLTSSFSDGMQRLGTSQGLYLMVEPTVADPQQMREEMGASASFVALSLDLKNQVRIGAVMNLDDADNASATVEEIDELRRQGASNPMAGLLGFGPLIQNLSIEQDGPEILIRSSMTNPEAMRLVEQFASIQQMEQQLEQPIDGDRFDDDATETDDTGSDGVDADFN